MEKIIKKREIFITLGITFLVILFGVLFDQKVTNALYDPENVPAFAIIMAAVAELPGYMVAVVTGNLFIIIAQRLKPNWAKYGLTTIGILAIIGGFFLTGRAFKFAAEFPQTEASASLIKITGFICSAVVTLLLTYYLQKNCLDLSLEKLVRVSLTIGFVLGFELVLGTILKYVISRPRPYYLVLNSAWDEYRNFWQIEPFKAFEMDDAFKSCPSGHSATSSVALILFPYFTLLMKKYQSSEKARVIAYYIGLVWALLTMLSRILAGAHFMSDTGLGLLLTLIFVFICNYYVAPFIYNLFYKDQMIYTEPKK